MVDISIEYRHPIGNVRKVIKENGEVWELEGECNRCGQCCEEIITPFLAEREKGCKYLGCEIINGVKMSKCDIIWERPFFCILYPLRPSEDLYEKCSYKWKRVK